MKSERRKLVLFVMALLLTLAMALGAIVPSVAATVVEDRNGLQLAPGGSGSSAGMG
jgi:hypothetical protein